MKYILFVLVAVSTLLFCGCNKNTSPKREEISFNQNWKFAKKRLLVAPPKSKSYDIDTTKWEMVNMPHTPQIEPLVVNNQWQGVMWYKKDFQYIKNNNLNAYIKFEGVMQEADIVLNGKHISNHLGGYLPFIVDLSKAIKNGKNTIEVLVNNMDNPQIPPGKPLKDLDFNYYGGIYRDVTFITTNKIHITDPIGANKIGGGGILTHFSDITAHLAHGMVKIHIKNDTEKNQKVHAKILWTNSKDNTIKIISEIKLIRAQKDKTITVNFKIENPALWDIEAPNLYTLKVLLFSDKGLVDEVSQSVGIRKIELNSEGFFLNNKKRYIRGTNRHQEYPYIGYALSDNAHYRDAVKIKQAGFDLVRLSHYPQDPAFLNACDDLGIMVMNAIPGWQFYQEGAFVENSYQNIRDMVRRDRNHPSVIFWENSLNESPMTDDYMIKANAILKEELPFDDTYSVGWIDHPSYDLYIPARQHSIPPNYWTKYNKDHRKIFIAEYGDWEYYAQNAGFNQSEFKNLMKDERTSRQLREYGEHRMLQQALNFQEAANSNRQGKNTIGHANWLMFDYNRGYSNDLESSGISDIFRLPKFAYYFYQSQRPESQLIKFRTIKIGGPMVKIATYWNKTSTPTVRVYSNCEEVALYLNDSLIERKQATKDRFSNALAYPPFRFNVTKNISGTLKAKGYVQDKEVCFDKVATPKQPYKIKIVMDKSGVNISKNKMDVLILHAFVVDEDGNTISSDHTTQITFEIYPPSDVTAKIIGDNPSKVKAGIASILLQTKTHTRPFELKASSVGLKSTSYIFK